MTRHSFYFAVGSVIISLLIGVKTRAEDPPKLTTKVAAKSDAQATVNFLKLTQQKSPVLPADLSREPPERTSRGKNQKPKTKDDDTFVVYNSITVPPDTNGAVGTRHVVTALNYSVLIHDKEGQFVASLQPHVFWSAIAGARTPFDPRMVFDPVAKRWVYTSSARIWGEAAKSDPALFIGVSKTDDATGDWYLHRVDVDPGKNRWWIDQGRSLGANKNWIIVHADIVNIDATAPRIYRYYAFDKAGLYAGGSGAYSVLEGTFGPAVTSYLGASPALTFDANQEDIYLIKEEQNVSMNPKRWLQVLKITGGVGKEQIVHVCELKSKKWDWIFGSAQGPQSGSKVALEISSGIGNVVNRNGSLWCIHTVHVPAENPKSSLQWWEFSPDGTLKQQGLIQDNARWFGYPSIAVSKANDVLIGYSRFAADQFVSANASYRRASDPISTLRPDTVFRTGLGTQNSHRWGDYSASCVDPTDDLTLWTVQMYAEAAEVVSPTVAISHHAVAWKRLKPK